MPASQGVYVRRVIAAVRVPGAATGVEIHMENRGETDVTMRLRERIPDGYASADLPDDTPVEITAGATRILTYRVTAPQTEGPALISGSVDVARQQERTTLVVDTPIATYPPHTIDQVQRLVDVRDRLIAVTNFHKRAGHPLMMDAVRY